MRHRERERVLFVWGKHRDRIINTCDFKREKKIRVFYVLEGNIKREKLTLVTQREREKKNKVKRDIDCVLCIKEKHKEREKLHLWLWHKESEKLRKRVLCARGKHRERKNA